MNPADKLIYDNLNADSNGCLTLGGHNVCDLAAKYGTPLLLMDSDRIREKCRLFKSAVNDAFGSDSRVLFASKAASFMEIYRIMKSEGLYVDVVSCGEMETALSAGFPLDNAVFHSCGKTDRDIEYAVENKIGCIAVDSMEELLAIDRICSQRGVVQNVILRLTPGIDPHTFNAVATGVTDSKFGFCIAYGIAEKALETALSLKHINVLGFHCHVGSQIFDKDVYIQTATIMLSFIHDVRRKYGFVTDVLDIGGGFGIRYTSSQSSADVASIIDALGIFMREACDSYGLKMPSVWLEPGRSIVADSGMTLYTALSVKEIPDVNTYVLIDGGMTDNVRYAMYKAPYTVVYPSDIFRKCDMKCTVAGRCCESGDIIQPDVYLPSSVSRGDFIAVLGTGAYNYSMASNYNRIPRPPVVMLDCSREFVAVRRETEKDLIGLDM